MVVEDGQILGLWRMTWMTAGAGMTTLKLKRRVLLRNPACAGSSDPSRTLVGNREPHQTLEALLLRFK